jgi:hypothetical protein
LRQKNIKARRSPTTLPITMLYTLIPMLLVK